MITDGIYLCNAWGKKRKSYTDPDVTFRRYRISFVTDPAQCWRLGRFILAEKGLKTGVLAA